MTSEARYEPLPAGSIVRWMDAEADEANDRFVVIEDNGDRVVVSPLDTYWDTQFIRPQQTVRRECVALA